PEDAARAAAQVLGGSTGIEPGMAMPMPMGQPVSGPRKWLRSATSIFSTRGGSRVTPLPVKTDGRGRDRRKLDAPMPLSEFAKRQKTNHAHTHTGHGRRDQLTAGERTRILRMLRDEGGRMADEESQVFVGAPPAPRYDADFDDDYGAPVGPPPSQQIAVQRGDVTAKPAVVVGIAQANQRRSKRQSAAPPPAPPSRQMPSQQPPPMPPRAKGPTQPPPSLATSSARSPKPRLPAPFDEKTRQVNDDELLAAVRSAPGPGRVDPRPNQVFDAPTRLGDIDPRLFEDETRPDDGRLAAKFLQANTEPSQPPEHLDESPFGDDEATRMANVDSISGRRRAKLPPPSSHEERTRAVDIRDDRAMSDIDWDID
ncbi:MAG: hypothetical protein ACM31C_27805, partial [Acidobacteriota bacterium]